MRGADQPPRRQGQQMADADYDFGGYDYEEAEDHSAPAGRVSGGVLRRYLNLAGALASLGIVAGFGEAAALAVQRLPFGFEVAHRGDRILHPLPRLACLVLPAFQGGRELGQVGVDAFDAVAGGVQLALLAQHLGEDGRALFSARKIQRV